MKRPLRLLLSVSLVIVAADQATKHLAHARLADAPAPVVEGHLELRYAENHTVSVLGGLPARVRGPVVLAASALGLAFLVLLLARWTPGDPALQRAVAWVIGGAGGNFLDRLFRGHVVEFVHLQWRERWPAFNVADVGLWVGLGLLLGQLLRLREGERPADHLSPGLSRS